MKVAVDSLPGMDLYKRLHTPIFWLMLVGMVASEIEPMFEADGHVNVISIIKIVIMSFFGLLAKQPEVMKTKPPAVIPLKPVRKPRKR